MRQQRDIMSMPVIVEIDDKEATPSLFDEVFAYFNYVDGKFSVFKSASEISAINRGELESKDWSDEMKEVFVRSEETKRLSGGYFDIVNLNGQIDPSGLVKGWAIFKAGKLLRARGVKNFYVEAGGDIEVFGVNSKGKPWRIGIENPLRNNDGDRPEIVKTLELKNQGVATSGVNKRGRHIYNPVGKCLPAEEIVSLTVVGPNVYEADRFATAAFAMGKSGLEFIERLEGFEGYEIDRTGMARMTSGFSNYTSETYA